MPDYAPYELDNEGPGTVRYRTVSGERKPTAKATAAKQVLAYPSITPPVPVPTGLDSTYISDITEAAQDAVGAMVANSSKVSLTYVDATPSLTADIVAGSLGPADIANRTRTMPVVPAGTIGATAEWVILAGAPDFAQRNSLYGAIAYDAAAAESVQWLRSVMVPEDYVSSLPIVLIWTNLGAGSGNVVWRISYTTATDTVAFPALTAATDITLTAPAQNVLAYSVITGASPSYSLGGLASFAVARIATDVADTLANDAGFVALRLRYTADS